MKEELQRSYDILPHDKLNKSICVIGAGAIGGWTTIALSKMGFGVTVFDFDKVSIENVGIQPYSKQDIGKPKVEVLKEITYRINGISIRTYDGKFKNFKRYDMFIFAVDSMSCRRELYGMLKGYNIIDLRMGAEQLNAYLVRDDYENTLYDDREAIQERCTAKATTYTAMLAGGIAAKMVKDWCMDTPTYTILWNIKENTLKAFR